MRDRRPWMAQACGVLLAAAGATSARAEPAPLVTLELRNTAEAWRNLQGGVSVGNTTLNKAQVSAHFDAERLGRPGLHAYVQVFKTNAESLSVTRVGDVQIISNIEAPHIERLFEAWVEQTAGDPDKSGWKLLRVGLIDLNRTFDSIETAGLFINSSHGIGPDLSRSGLAGPAIFPATGPGAQIGWRPSDQLALHLGVFAAPDPSGFDRFVDLRVTASAGATVIGQADWTVAKDVQASLGVWRYTADLPSLADPSRRLTPRPGVYGFVQGPTPLPGGPSGWLRVGVADDRVEAVAGYLGAGLVWKGVLPARDHDAFGVAVAHAVIADEARRRAGLPAGETTLEATYSFRLGKHLHLQPDVQWIIHPASQAGLDDALAVGLRVVAFARVSDPADEDD